MHGTPVIPPEKPWGSEFPILTWNMTLDPRRKKYVMMINMLCLKTGKESVSSAERRAYFLKSLPNFQCGHFIYNHGLVVFFIIVLVCWDYIFCGGLVVFNRRIVFNLFWSGGIQLCPITHIFGDCGGLQILIRMWNGINTNSAKFHFISIMLLHHSPQEQGWYSRVHILPFIDRGGYRKIMIFRSFSGKIKSS